LLLGVLAEQAMPTSVIAQDPVSMETGLSEDQLAFIDDIVKEAIRTRKTPGAVVLIGKRGKVVYRRAFGHRALSPKKLPMTVETIFDLSSLTKVIATTPALLQLVEKGKLQIDDPVAKFWPEFQAKGKEQITVRQLLTHYSGLQPALDLKPKWSGTTQPSRRLLPKDPFTTRGHVLNTATSIL